MKYLLPGTLYQISHTINRPTLSDQVKQFIHIKIFANTVQIPNKQHSERQ